MFCVCLSAAAGRGAGGRGDGGAVAAGSPGDPFLSGVVWPAAEAVLRHQPSPSVSKPAMTCLAAVARCGGERGTACPCVELPSGGAIPGKQRSYHKPHFCARGTGAVPHTATNRHTCTPGVPAPVPAPDSSHSPTATRTQARRRAWRARRARPSWGAAPPPRPTATSPSWHRRSPSGAASPWPVLIPHTAHCAKAPLSGSPHRHPVEGVGPVGSQNSVRWPLHMSSMPRARPPLGLVPLPPSLLARGLRRFDLGRNRTWGLPNLAAVAPLCPHAGRGGGKP